MPDTPLPDKSLPAQSQKAQTRAAKLHRRAGLPALLPPGLLPDALEELHATIEELRVAEEEMRTQNEEILATRLVVEAERHRYRDLFEFAPDGILVTTLDGEILEANRASAALLGITPRFLKKRLLATLAAPESLPEFSARLSAPAPQALEWRLRLRRRPAGTFQAAVSVSPVAVPPGAAPALRWQVRDITAQVQAQAEAQAALREAEVRQECLAESLERVLLPATPLAAFPTLAVAVRRAAGASKAESGGGFLDMFSLPDGAVALTVGSVSGGGNTAAALTAEVKYALRVFLREAHRPASALARLNEFLCEAVRLGDFPAGRSAAASAAVLDTYTGETLFAGGGGAPLLVLRADGTAKTAHADGPRLGVQPGTVYEEQCPRLGPGDTLLLTDIIRVASPSGEPPGTARLAEIAAAALSGTVDEAADNVLAQVRAWTGGSPPDDASLLLARRAPKSAADA